jgi:uncharacterized RDD family membrane protein YckC
MTDEQAAPELVRPALPLADKGTRVVGYLIDVVPTLLIGLLGLIPIVGIMLKGLLLCPYWLLRDVTGSSLGKLVMGSRVVLKDGREAPVSARILRNLPIAIPGGLLVIPFLGYVLDSAIFSLPDRL